MKFNRDKYRILDDIGDKGVLLSEGAMRTINILKDEAKEVEEIFGAFCTNVIIKCKKGYYLSKQINDTLVEDIAVQEKLNKFLHNLNSTMGIMLLPNSKYSSIFNSLSYFIGKNNDFNNELNFSIAFHSARGLEIFISGIFVEKKFQSMSFASDDIEFYDKRDLVIERLVNYALNILLFMQFAEIETVITEGNKSKGKSRIKFNNEKFLNESKIPIEIIDSKWFKRLIRIGAFKVNGHFRIQPYGKQNSLLKLIWISDYNKKGYKSNPKILNKN